MDEPATSTLRLPPSARSPRLAREYAERFLRERGRLELAPRTALLVSELVTNAMVHAEGGCTLRISVVTAEAPCVRVEVEDTAADAAVEPTGTGTGLRLVADTAQRWGVERSAGGKTVWAELS